MTSPAGRRLHVGWFWLLVVLCFAALVLWKMSTGPQPALQPLLRSDRGAPDTNDAITIATLRLREHGQRGFSRNDLARTRDWFTADLYALLERDMSGPGEVGYLNWDPFTGAQDDVGPFRLEDATRAGDTVNVRFSREGFERKREDVTIAMLRVDGVWRIANFIYPGRGPCYRDLASGLARHAGISGKAPCVDSVSG